MKHFVSIWSLVFAVLFGTVAPWAVSAQIVDVSADSQGSVEVDSDVSVEVDAVVNVNTPPQDDRKARRSFFKRLLIAEESESEDADANEVSEDVAEANTGISAELKADRNDRLRLLQSVKVDLETNKNMPPQNDRIERRMYLQAQTAFQTALESYRNRRAAFLEAKAELRANADAEHKEAMRVRAEAFLRQTITTLIERLERMSAWVENHPNIDATVAADVQAKIDAEISALTTLAANLSADATVEEIQSIAADVRARLAMYNEKVRASVDAMKSSRLRTAITNAEATVDRLAGVITEFEAKGVAVAEARAELADASATLTLAAQAYAEGNTALAKEHMIDAYQTLRSVIVHLKAANKVGAAVDVEA